MSLRNRATPATVGPLSTTNTEGGFIRVATRPLKPEERFTEADCAEPGALNEAGTRWREDEPRPPRFDDGPDIDVPVTLRPRVCPTLLVLPYPPSANTLYRTIVRGKRATPIKSAEHRAYFAAVASRVGFLAVPWSKETPLVVTLRLFRPRKSGDIDGPIKALLDSLNGRAWVDDSQIVELHITRHDDRARPRVEVSIAAGLTRSEVSL